MFKVGDKAKGFKFSSEQYKKVGYVPGMDSVVGKIGTVTHVGEFGYAVEFPDNEYPWSYPKELWHLGKVDEVNPFNVGDKVKFKKSSIDSGMIGASADDTFTVLYSQREHVMLQGQETWWNICHLEHVKEEIVNNTEEKEIKWEIGQEVWCCVFGKGVVKEILGTDNGPYPLRIDFPDNGDEAYTLKGELFKEQAKRTLFFSEPKIEAEKFPPKKPFVAKLKKGDMVFVKHKNLYKECYTLEVDYEEEDAVWFKNENDGYLKSAWNFFKIGEEIIFN